MSEEDVFGSEDDSKLQWYVVHAASGYENFVKEALEKRIEELGINASFDKIIVPTERVVELRQGRKYEVEKKFFPGYVLVQMMMTEKTWHIVRKIPKVLGFIGGRKGKPTAIPDKKAEEILQQVEASVDKPKPKVLFEAGEVVRVTDGPFADFSGVVEEVNYEKNRLRVAVLIFGRSTPVELEFSQVEKA